MRATSRKLLFDIAQACRRIQDFNAGGSLHEYSADAMRRAATERMFEVVGEALLRLRETDPATFAYVPDAHAIIGFRNRLVHGYDSVDDEIVWKIVSDRVPGLQDAADALLEEPESTDE